MQLDSVFLLQASSLEFLRTHNFDLNKVRKACTLKTMNVVLL